MTKNSCEPCVYPNFLFNGDCIEKCPFGQYMFMTPTGLVCKTVCPDGHFENDDNGKCDPCHESCLTCDKKYDQCDFPCPYGKYWHNYRCIDVCPLGTYLSGLMTTNFGFCDTTDHCRCENCHPDCLVCIGPSHK